MCSVCKHIMPGFGIAHEVILCPFRAGLYCSMCAQYGHSRDDCPVNKKRMIYIKDTEEGIKEFLTQQRVKLGKNNKRLLQEYAEMNSMRIVYLV